MIDELKNDRIDMLTQILLRLEVVKKLYMQAYPGWILINSTEGFIKSLYHLESSTNFDDETLGVRFKDES
jgi:hypothetical protein